MPLIVFRVVKPPTTPHLLTTPPPITGYPPPTSQHLSLCLLSRGDFKYMDVKHKRVHVFVATTFLATQASRGFCVTCLVLNLIVHIKTMRFITFSTKHPMCKISLCLNRCLMKVKTKILQACLSQFCNHSWLLFIVLYFQVININPY